MTLLSPSSPLRQIDYPEDDGNPLSDHTLQFDWIALIKGNLDALFSADPDVFVAGDLLWYPVEGDNRTRVAPDVLVAFGRPKGPRGSYRQWAEGGVAPQVVFEILSPGNRFSEMLSKLEFYQRFGVEEYYLYNPFNYEFDAWIREGAGGRLIEMTTDTAIISPRMGVRFVPSHDAPVEVFLPDGRAFLTFDEMKQAADDAGQRADQAEKRAADAEQRARQSADQVAAMAMRLRELGIDPETI